MIEHLDELSEEALAIQAVNTVKVMPDGKLKGFNTDYLGLMKLFKTEAVTGKRLRYWELVEHLYLLYML